jgi:hypothetical protein
MITADFERLLKCTVAESNAARRPEPRLVAAAKRMD